MYQHHTPTHSSIFILLSSFHFHSQQCPMLMQCLHKGSAEGFSQPETFILGIQPTRNIHFGDSANHKCSFWGFRQTETFIWGIQPTRNIHFGGFSQPETFILGDSANQKHSFWGFSQQKHSFLGFSQPETFIFGIQPTRNVNFSNFVPPWFECPTVSYRQTENTVLRCQTMSYMQTENTV